MQVQGTALMSGTMMRGSKFIPCLIPMAWVTTIITKQDYVQLKVLHIDVTIQESVDLEFRI